MYAVLGEDTSDVDMLKVLIRRIGADDSIRVNGKGYGGCAAMLKKGARDIRAFKKSGFSRFIICYDSDGDNAVARYQKIVSDVIKESGVTASFCALIPIQELEAWILADLAAVTNVIPSWKPTEVIANPESKADPKEYLEGLSALAKNRPLYTHAVHNARVAKYLDLEEIATKCRSSLPLFEIVKKGKGNHPRWSLDDEDAFREEILKEFRESRKESN